MRKKSKLFRDWIGPLGVLEQDHSLSHRGFRQLRDDRMGFDARDDAEIHQPAWDAARHAV